MNVNVGILNVVGGGSDLVLDLIQKLTLLLSQEGKVEEHLMQLCNALLERQHVLILAGYICICRPVVEKNASRSSWMSDGNIYNNKSDARRTTLPVFRIFLSRSKQNSLDGIRNATSQNAFPVQSLSSAFTSHYHVHIFIRRVRLDNLHLPRHLLFDIRLVLLLRVLIQLHFINEFPCQSVAQIFSNTAVLER